MAATATSATIDNMTHAEIVVNPELLAANDNTVLDVIEDHLLDSPHNTVMTDDLVLCIQEYIKSQNSATQAALALVAERAKLRGVFKLVQIIKNSPAFAELVAYHTPDELSAVSSQPSVKQTVVATSTTAQAIAATPKPTKDAKASKSKSKAEKLLEGVTDAPKDAIAAHKPTKVKQSLPMPTIKTIADIEALDRKGLVAAVKAIKSHNPDITLRANAASVELQKLLVSEMMGVDYTPAPKATKAAKGNTTSTSVIKKEDINLVALTWEGCKDMSYRQLQQVCGALKLKGLFSGNCGGKGATKDAFLKGIATYFKGQGVVIVEVAMTPANNIKPLSLPNLAAARKDQAAKVAVAA